MRFETSKVILSRQGLLMSPIRISLAFTAIALAMSVPSVHANQSWDGGGTNDNWNSPANWGSDTSPNFGNAINFGGNTRTSPINNLTAGTTIGGINFTNNGVSGSTAAFAITGNGIVLGGALITTAVTTGPTIADSISFDMTLNAARTVTTNAGHDLTLSGVIGQDATNRNLSKAGLGTLTLSNAANTFAGQFLADSGTTKVVKLANNGSASSLGQGTASFRLGNDATATLEYIGTTDNSTNKVLQIGTSVATNTGAAKILNNGTGKLTFNAANFNATVANVTVPRALTLGGSYTGAANEITGIIQNCDTAAGGIVSLTKEGASTWVLSGANTYTGSTTVTEGVLRLNGSLSASSNMSVAAAAWLSGTGSANGTATITGTLSPAANSTAGVLSLGSLVLNSAANSLIDLAAAGTRGTDYDGVSILNSAGLTYGGTMSLAFGGSLLPNNTTFSIFSFTGVSSGSFAQVASTGYYAGTWTNNNDGTYSLAKDSQTLTFTQSTGQVIVVPEPTTAAAVVMGVAAVAVVRMRRRHRSKACCS